MSQHDGVTGLAEELEELLKRLIPTLRPAATAQRRATAKLVAGLFEAVECGGETLYRFRSPS